jgi:D-alanyl-D-alanine carboxypeptidase
MFGAATPRRLQGSQTPPWRTSARRGLRALLLLLFLLPQPGVAADLVFRLETGEILIADEADAPWHPASLTKLMTAYVLFQALATGRLTLDQELTVSAAAAKQPPTSLGVAEGRTLTVEEALLGLLMRSGNDTAVVLAEAVSGSEAAFVDEMNFWAERLSMLGTYYVNPSGLPDDLQITTARDLALLAQALIRDFPQYYNYFGRSGFIFAGDWRGNINGILGSLSGADGMKTGFTCKSGYNLVVSVLRNGQRVVAVVLGDESPAGRSARARALVEAAFLSLADPDRVPGPQLVPHPADYLVGAPAPAVVLEQNECGYGVSQRLPGWGVVLGKKGGRGSALSLAEKMRDAYGVFEGAGVAAVPAKRGGGRWHAVLTGLSKSEAQRGCAAIRKGGGYCLVVAPAVLNNAKAAWR